MHGAGKWARGWPPCRLPPISALRVGESSERGMLVVAAVVEGKERRALVGTGCTHMLVTVQWQRGDSGGTVE